MDETYAGQHIIDLQTRIPGMESATEMGNI